MKSRKNISLAVSVFTILLLMTACGRTKQAMVEQSPAYQASPQATPVKIASAPAPKLPEVEEAVKRIFKDAAVVHPDYKSNVLTGDFNGDLSQDLAVIITPVPEKLTEINEEPRWLLRDPLANRAQKTQLRVEKDDLLLAVIHGYGTNDWRDPEATQTFVLKNVVGANLHVQNGKEFVTANAGRKLPQPQGDLIGETLKGNQGCLYYAAATYSWYDPQTFTGVPETPGVFHRRSGMRR